MTISSTTNKVQYTGNAVTTSFSFPYVFFAQADLTVTLYDTTANAAISPAPVLNGSGTYDYTISGTFDTPTGEYLSGANVVFNTAPPANYRITIERIVSPTQLTALVDGSKFPAATVNGTFDKLTVLVQRAYQLITQALYYPSSDPSTVSNILPDAATRASKYLGFDSNGNPTALGAPANTTAVSSFWSPILLLTTGAASQAALGINSFWTTILALTTAAASRDSLAAVGVTRIQTFTSPPTTITMTIASPAVLSWTAHGLAVDQAFQITTTGALPTGVTASTTYYVVSTGYTANSFQFSATRGGTSIVTTGSQSGTHTGTPFYSPNSKMVACISDALGGGGGGGGTVNSSASNTFQGAGGGAGSRSLKYSTAAQIGAGQLVTIGAAGSGGAAGNNNGTAGGDTSVGAICIGKAGQGGIANNSSNPAGGAGGVAGTGDITTVGQAGANGVLVAIPLFTGGGGGWSHMGGGGQPPAGSSATGGAGTGRGTGGAGGLSFNAGLTQAGGNGTAGYVAITEFCTS